MEVALESHEAAVDISYGKCVDYHQVSGAEEFVEDSIFILSGDRLQRYYIESNCWRVMAEPTCMWFWPNIVIVDDWLYAIGGKGGGNWKGVERYNIVHNEWHQDVADMKVNRRDFVAAYFDGYIYCFGGIMIDHNDVSSEVERYCIATNEWEIRAHSPVKIRVKNVAAIGGEFFIDYYGVVYSYNPNTDIWTLFTKHRGTIPSSCVVGTNKIYYIHRSFKSGLSLRSVNMRNPLSKKSRLIQNLHERLDQMNPDADHRLDYRLLGHSNGILYILKFINIGPNEISTRPYIPFIGSYCMSTQIFNLKQLSQHCDVDFYGASLYRARS